MSSLPRLTVALALHAVVTMAVAAGSGLDTPGFDPDVRVQDNLFLATNGGWLKATEIPADKSWYGAILQMRDICDERVHAIVDELATHPHEPGSVARKLGDFYAGFLDTEAIDKAGRLPIEPVLAGIDAIASPRELAQWEGRVQGRLETPIQLWVQADAKQPTLNRALTWQGGLGLPDRDYYLDRDDPRMVKARTAYQAYLATLAAYAGEEEPARAALRVIELERRIAQAHWSAVANRDPVKAYNPMTPAELARLAPGFDWPAFLAAANLAGQDRLIVSQPDTTTAIAKMHADVPLADWKLYFKLRTLDNLATLLPQPLRGAHFAFHRAALEGAKEPAPRWRDGIDALNSALGEAVGQLYVARYFPADHKARVQQLVNNLLAAYQISIDGLTWMSPATKVQAQAKLAKIRTKIGYPDKWRDYSTLEVHKGDAVGNALRAARFEWERIAAQAGKPVDRGEWYMTPQTVNAYYDPNRNDINFPAGFLQPPVFDIGADDAVNYGAIGAIIGHEISHGFDDAGSQFDGDGMLRSWWSDADRKAFETLTARLVSQFDAYEPLPGKHVNGNLTLGENIADLSGLQIAYKAYRRALNGKPSPLIDGYSGEQRFFLGWARFWRSKARDERMFQWLINNPHAPDEFRTNGAAVNVDGFHDAFGTQPGDTMYKPASERIRIW